MVVLTETAPGDWGLPTDDPRVMYTILEILEERERRAEQAAAHGPNTRSAPGAGGPIQFSG